MCSVKRLVRHAASAGPATRSSQSLPRLRAHGRTVLNRRLLPMAVADLRNLLLRRLVAGIDLGGAQQFRPVRPASSPAASSLRPLVTCMRGIREPDPVEGRSKALVLRRHRKGLLKILEGGIEVVARLGGLALLVITVGRLREALGLNPQQSRVSMRKYENPETRIQEDGGRSGAGRLNAAFHRTPGHRRGLGLPDQTRRGLTMALSTPAMTNFPILVLPTKTMPHSSKAPLQYGG